MRIALIALSCFCFIASVEATVESWDPGTGTGTIGPGGCVGK